MHHCADPDLLPVGVSLRGLVLSDTISRLLSLQSSCAVNAPNPQFTAQAVHTVSCGSEAAAVAVLLLWLG